MSSALPAGEYVSSTANTRLTVMVPNSFSRISFGSDLVCKNSSQVKFKLHSAVKTAPRLSLLAVSAGLVAGLYYYYLKFLMRRQSWPLDHYPLLSRTQLAKRHVQPKLPRLTRGSHFLRRCDPLPMGRVSGSTWIQL